MARRLSRYNDFRGKLHKYNEEGNYLEEQTFRFNIVQSRNETINPMTGTPIRKGDFLLRTEDPINPVTGQDKVEVEWREKHYIVGNTSGGKRKGDNSGRRGRLKKVMDFYIE